MRLSLFLSNRYRAFIFIFSAAFVIRVTAWILIPVDWNWDSYHHWQISYLTLKIGLSQGRMWDLSGSEYYWGVVPHLVQAFFMWMFSTASIIPYRALNLILGSVNAYLVFIIGKDTFDEEVGLHSGLLFALFPIAVIFDTIAMQETLALSFALLSLYLFRKRPFWSGVFLALATQSRIEFWLVSVILIIGVIVAERASNRIFPFVLSWVLVTGVFCWFFATRTLNAFYPLYYSLYNFFGGWTEEGRGKPLLTLMLSWTSSKLVAWTTKPTGALILGSVAASFGLFIHMVVRRWRRYHVYLFFIASVAVFGPLFIPFFALEESLMLLMLRMTMSIAAAGFVILLYLLFGTRISKTSRSLRIEKVLILVTLLSYSYFIPAYARFEINPKLAFDVADLAMNHYRNGTIVCDYPTMNYWFVYHWQVPPQDLLGNHYSPAYYGIYEPIEYARWLRRNGVTMMVHTVSEEADIVQTILGNNFPGLLIQKVEIHGIRIFLVNQTALTKITGG